MECELLDIYTNKRDDNIDAMRGIGMALVVLGHTCYSMSEFVNWINSFHMPFFFIISGYLFNGSELECSFSSFCKKRAERLMLPYYLFAFLSSIGTIIFGISRSDTQIIIDTVVSRTIGIKIGTNVIGPIWFLMVLFLSSIIEVYLCKKNKELGIYIFSGGTMLYSLYTGALPNIPGLLGLSGLAVLFLHLGRLIRRNDLFRHIKALDSWVDSLLLFIILVFSIILLWSVYKSNGAVNMYEGIVGNPLIYIVNAVGWSVLVCFMILFIGKYIPLGLISDIGKNTMIILFIHFYIMVALVYIVTKIGGEDLAKGPLFQIALSVIILLISYLLSKFFNYFLVGHWRNFFKV